MSPPDPSKTLVGLTPDHTESSRLALTKAFALLQPVLSYRASITTTTDTALDEEVVADVDRRPAALQIAADETYTRPNGETYRPRTIVVSGVKVQDVTFIRASYNAKKSVLLYGPPGTGKTALIEAAVPDVITVQGTVETEVADFVGSYVPLPNGEYEWVDGPLVVAAKEGRPLLIDEIALIDPRQLSSVYGAMDGRGEIVVTQNPTMKPVKVQPGFCVFGAFNPDVPGAILSDAMLSRFPIQVEVSTDWSVAAELGISAKITQVARNLNGKKEKGEVTAAPQLRELIAFRDIAALFGEEFALSNFIGQIRPENRAVALDAVKSVFGIPVTSLSF